MNIFQYQNNIALIKILNRHLAALVLNKIQLKMVWPVLLSIILSLRMNEL